MVVAKKIVTGTFVRNNFQAPDTLLELAGADENSID